MQEENKVQYTITCVVEFEGRTGGVWRDYIIYTSRCIVRLLFFSPLPPPPKFYPILFGLESAPMPTVQMPLH